MMIDQSFVKRFLVILLFVFAFQPAAAQELEVLRVPLAANALLYHDDLERLIAATPSTGSAIPNSIVLIDPVTGAIENSMFVGSDIRVLALSDNGVLPPHQPIQMWYQLLAWVHLLLLPD